MDPQPQTTWEAGDDLAERYQQVRAFSEQICAPLVPEDYVIQSMPDVSPAKWHLAHTSWFFETFLLKPHLSGYESLHPQYDFLFNSYYNAVGERHCRTKRGHISRPTVEETYAYRHFVDEAMRSLLCGADGAKVAELAPLVILGLHHEQQHQELMLTDIKHVFAQNPLRPAYGERRLTGSGAPVPHEWLSHAGGLAEIGYAGGGFYFDNEGPRHTVYLQPFAIASRLVTCGEYQNFMADGGYTRPELWLSMGWAEVQAQGWKSPFYWEEHDGRWLQMTLAGLRPVEPDEPVCHVNYFEVDAYARWAGARLPGEAEWETAALCFQGEVPLDGSGPAGNFAESGAYHPEPQRTAPNFYGDVWQWTRSQYEPYPGYAPAAGALGEYNGKFMCNQFVLRGGSCATSRTHIRATYRNFFPPDACWQFTGIRLAKDS